MAIVVHCPNPACRGSFTAPDRAAGKRKPCPACGQGLQIPKPPPDATREDVAALPAAEVEPEEDTWRIGKYALGAKLGGGAFGEVYRARDTQLGREVALKVPRHGTLENPDAVTRFLREAQAAARLQHPGIVPVHDAGRADDTYFIAYGYIAGQPLGHLIPEKGLPPAQAAGLVAQMAEALAYAHWQGVLHRDVKPANVMVDGQGRTYLVDFGLARTCGEEASRLTQSGAIIGTPAYMAPELLGAAARQAGPAADQYSLGVTLYHLLTGELPFQGPVAAVMAQVILQPPEPPTRLRPDLDPALEAICLKAMAKQPAGRFPDCGALAAALRGWLAGDVRTATSMPAPAAPPTRTPAVKTASGTQTARATAGRKGAAQATARPPRLRRRPGRAPWLAAGLVAVPLIGVVTWLATRPPTTDEATGPRVALVGPSHPEDTAARERQTRMEAELRKQREELERLRREAEKTRPAAPTAPAPATSPRAPAVRYVANSLGMKFIRLVPGKFVMGSPEDEPGRLPNEGPAHEVTLTRSWYLGAFEVTQAEYRAVMGPTPQGQVGDDLPVEVSWTDAQGFCAKLAEFPEEKRVRRLYRLPTEAEWEYACRAGTTTPYSFGAEAGKLGEYAWYEANSGGRLHPVGLKLPNPWGFHDLHGNALEWCQDWHEDGAFSAEPATDPAGPAAGARGLRVARGGSFLHQPAALRSASRQFAANPTTVRTGRGFRVRMQVGGADAPGGVAQAPVAEEPLPVAKPTLPAFVNAAGIKLTHIPAGKFRMGTRGAVKPEGPLHEVEISRGFFLGTCEVTTKQFRAVMGDAVYLQIVTGQPVTYLTDNHPMVLLSWERAQEFCTRLSGLAVEKKAGRTYRLPTEAEWEYACRAGTTTTYFFGDDATKLAEYAWTAENANRQVHPVGQKKPNPWGLYDLYGNAGEWCQDAYDADFYGKSPPRDPFNKPVAVDDVYVHRGGDIFHQAANTRSALRFSMKGRKSFMFAGGMRVVCEVAGK